MDWTIMRKKNNIPRKITACFSCFLCLCLWALHAEAKTYPSYQQALQQEERKRIQIAMNASFRPDDLWQRITENYQMPHYANHPAVIQQINWFKAHPEFIYRVVHQGTPYFYHVTKQVSKSQMPGELVLLPMIESAYDPFAYSWVGAAGLWQFMPPTAKESGLKQDWWFDGRRDIINSTDAALRYLSYLNKFFNGNWLYAVASYNAGAGTVQRAIRYNKKHDKPTDFWHLPLPQQTKTYVPRLLAISMIINNPKKYGFKLTPMKAEPYFASVNVGRQIELAQAAKMANISLAELYRLNAGYSRWITAPEGPHRIIVPVEKANHFRKNLASALGTPYKPYQAKNYFATLPTRYIVKPNDTLSNIAKELNVSVVTIKQFNRLNTDTIYPKQILSVPTREYYLAHNNSISKKQQIAKSKTRKNTTSLAKVMGKSSLYVYPDILALDTMSMLRPQGLS